MIDLRAEGIAARVDPSIGMLASFEVAREDRTVVPLHRAPWVGREEMPEGTAPHMARLGGDFLCAPFGMGDPLHGAPANAPWEVVERGASHLRAVLTETVQGARIEKRIELRDGHPFVYQTHVLSGGTGHLPLANHACVAVPDGGRITASPKSAWITPETPLETDPACGRSALLYPAEATDPALFPGADGHVDLTRYPWGETEDFVSGVEAGLGLGWTAVACPGHLFLSLRDAARLPMTMLWHSNGGRLYAPWSGRHRGCLGVEEGAAGHMIGDGPEVTLGDEVIVRHVIGAVPWDGGAVTSVALDGGTLTVTGETAARTLPVRADMLP